MPQLKTLHAWNPDECATSKPIEVQLGSPGITLMIFSGIAIPTLHIDDDDETDDYEVILKLGVNVTAIHDYVVEVGLASIANDESQFIFSTNMGTLDTDKTNELQLHTYCSIRGDETYLHRFSYQVVAQVTKIDSRISGTIRVPRHVLDLTNKTQSELEAMFRVRAQYVETLPHTPGTPPFLEEKLTPVADGRIEGVSFPPGSDDSFVNYVIDGCPFNLPLRVTVDITSLFANLHALRTPGPDPVLLTIFVPTVTGIDFAIVVTPLK